jgi:hypothetical protein
MIFRTPSPLVEVSMRSKLVLCAAIVVASAYASPRLASAAGKGKPAKADKAGAPELHADDKSMKRQMQWEDKVMGPDSTKADLARVARAHALNEKAIKEREAQAAREAAAPPPPVVKAAPPKRAEVALPSVNDGAAPSSSTKSDEPSHTPISAKLMSDEAKASPTPVKPADDKFIEKLLHEEQASHKKATTASDRELEKLLAGANEPKHGRGKDEVDSLIKNRDSGPAMPAPRAQSALPAWTQQPDIPSRPEVTAPPVAPVAAKPVKKDDGVIHVVQGAGNAPPVAAAPPPPARASKPTRAPTSRSVASSSEWSDPFADPSADGRVATRDAAPRRAPASRPASSSTSNSWNDPFADKPATKSTGRAPATTPAAPKRGEKEPAHGPGWKDPFTEVSTPPSRAPVAMREPAGHLQSARWEPVAKRAPARAPSPEPTQGWGLLKKRAR